MIYRDDISNLREDIVGKEGQKIIVKGALGRSRFFEKEATLEKAYPNLFVVKYNKEEGNATYSYTDVLTRTIDLQVFDGENYCSIVQPKLEEQKKLKDLTKMAEILTEKEKIVLGEYKPGLYN